MLVEPLVDLPYVIQLPTRNYWMATTQRHINSERSGKEERCKVCAKKVRSKCIVRGRFRTAQAQRAHSATYYGDYPGNNPENHPPCGIMHNQFKTQKFKHLMLAMGPRDLNSAPYSPVHCSSHSMTSFQSSKVTELPVVENSQLFAQRAHSARYAPLQQELVRFSACCGSGWVGGWGMRGHTCFRTGRRCRATPQCCACIP